MAELSSIDINNVNYNIKDVGAVANNGYFTCDTAAATAAKTVSSSDYALSVGGSIKIKMTNANTAASGVTLKMGSAAAKPLYYAGQIVNASNTWRDGETIEVYYDGTNYQSNNVAGSGNLQVIDDEPTAGSSNLVESGGVYEWGKENYGFYKSQTKAATQGVTYYNNFDNINIPSGKKFKVKATGDVISSSANILNLYINSANGTSLGNISINGNAVEITAPSDITTLVCFRYSGYVTSSGSVTVEVLIEGTVIYADLADIRAGLSTLDLTDKKAFGYKETFSKGSAGSVIKSFEVKTGETYTLKNTGSYEITARTSDSNGNVIQWISLNGLQGGESVTFVANTDASYVTVNCTTANGGSAEIFINSLQQQIDDINGDITEINNSVSQLDADVTDLQDVIEDINKNLQYSWTNDYYYTTLLPIGTKWSDANRLVSDQSGSHYTSIDLASYAGGKVKITVSGSLGTSGRGTYLVSEDYIIQREMESDYTPEGVEWDIPQNTVLYLSLKKANSAVVNIIKDGIQKEILAIDKKINNIEVFVSTDGNDTNIGTVNAPFATVAEAVSRGYKNICVKNGVYMEMLNFSGKNDLHIYAYNNTTLTAGNKRTRPIFTNGTEYNTFVDEGNSIKSFELSAVPSKYNAVFINKTTAPTETYQGFANTVNAGLWGKCTNRYEDFIFKPVLTLEGLSEDDTFYFDGTKVYFHTSKTIESVVVVGNKENIASFLNCNNLVIEGIEFEYGYNDTLIAQKSNGVLMNNCVFSHSLRRNNTSYDYSDITFVNCLSYKARRDGFNAAICGIARLVNCNSLYNYDDGESSHEYCEVIIEGGEYAYNGKAGHAPVNGCKFSCNGTYAHDNYVNGLLRNGGSGYSVSPYLISSSVFINNGTDIVTDIDINMMNCKYVTKTGEGVINNLTE